MLHQEKWSKIKSSHFPEHARLLSKQFLIFHFAYPHEIVGEIQRSPVFVNSFFFPFCPHTLSLLSQETIFLILITLLFKTTSLRTARPIRPIELFLNKIKNGNKTWSERKFTMFARYWHLGSSSDRCPLSSVSLSQQTQATYRIKQCNY